MYTASKYIYPHKREKDYRGPTLFERIFNSDKVYNPAKSYLRTLISSGFDLNRKYVYIDGEQYDSAYETLVEVYLSKLDSDKRNQLAEDNFIKAIECLIKCTKDFKMREFYDMVDSIGEVQMKGCGEDDDSKMVDRSNFNYKCK